MNNQQRPFGSIVPLLLFAGLLVGLYFLAKGIFSLLYYVAPILLIVTLFLDHKTVVNFVKYIWNQLSTNLPVGLLLLILTFFFYPIAIGFLFSKVMIKRQLKDAQFRTERGPFENRRSRPSTQNDTPESDIEDAEVIEEFLELPEIDYEKKKSTPSSDKDDKYDNFFS